MVLRGYTSLFIVVAYSPLSCHMKKAISNFFRNFSQKALAGLEIKSYLCAVDFKADGYEVLRS